MRQRILVVDDDKQIVRLVAAYLEQAGYQTLTAYDGAAALRAIRTERPDLVVLDLMLPDQDGWAITRQVRADSSLSRLPIIMLTARVEETDKLIVLELGADDYITKPFSPRELVARVRVVLRRAGGDPASEVLRAGDVSLDRARYELTLPEKVIALTPTEFEILATLMGQPGRIFSRAQLLSAARGVSFESYERSIDSHIRNLRRKLETDDGQARYIVTVHGVGYKFEA